MRFLATLAAGYMLGLSYVVLRERIEARRLARMLDRRAWDEKIAAMRRLEREDNEDA